MDRVIKACGSRKEPAPCRVLQSSRPLPRKLNGGQFKKTLALTTMVLPGAIWYLLLRYLPMGGIVMSFLDYKLPTRKIPFPVNLFHSKWVGLKNFSFLFTSESWVMIRNTLGYNALWIVMGPALCP